MNEVVNKFLLVGDKFMPEMPLKQPGLTYSTYGTFTRNKERIEQFIQTGHTDFFFTLMSLIRLVFKMIWLMANQKTQQKELNETKF